LSAPINQLDGCHLRNATGNSRTNSVYPAGRVDTCLENAPTNRVPMETTEEDTGEEDGEEVSGEVSGATAEAEVAVETGEEE
jgi:hypothetical protein